MANLYRDQIIEKFPKVDHILGSGAVDKVLTALQGSQQWVEGETRSYLEMGEVSWRDR
jgi:tRNA A37 methylthiotransferase MiaB